MASSSGAINYLTWKVLVSVVKASKGWNERESDVMKELMKADS